MEVQVEKRRKGSSSSRPRSRPSTGEESPVWFCPVEAVYHPSSAEEGECTVLPQACVLSKKKREKGNTEQTKPSDKSRESDTDSDSVSTGNDNAKPASMSNGTAASVKETKEKTSTTQSACTETDSVKPSSTSNGTATPTKESTQNKTKPSESKAVTTEKPTNKSQSCNGTSPVRKEAVKDGPAEIPITSIEVSSAKQRSQSTSATSTTTKDFTRSKQRLSATDTTRSAVSSSKPRSMSSNGIASVTKRPEDTMTEIELTCVEPQVKPRSTIQDANGLLIQEEKVATPAGAMLVSVQGLRNKPAIVTFHDIGLNHVTCFLRFFTSPEMQPLLRHFCVYHVNAPGQENGAAQMKAGYAYPSIDVMAEGIHAVVKHFGLKRFIGFGVGAGANILTRYTLCHPTFVDSLFLVNPNSSKAGWIEWGYQKMNSWYLISGQMTSFTTEYLLWHWFGKKTMWVNLDLIAIYREYAKSINPQNLALFIESYLKRTNLGLVRELDPIKRKLSRTINCRSLIVVGDDSPHVDDAVEMNSKMDPGITDFMKIADCGGAPLEEQPDKVCEAFRLFLQGMGYVPSLGRKQSMAAGASLPCAGVQSSYYY